MATSKQSIVRATEPQFSVSAQREEDMHVKAPLTTMYVHNGSAPGLQPYSQTQPRALQDATIVPLFLPGMCGNQPLSALTQISNSTALQQQRLGVQATSSRPKSFGKHVCQHCGKDCLKPSVLEKHLRCHTGERPYPCTICGISFKTQSNLYKHKRTQAHARLSNESDKGTFSSQENTDISKDSCITSSSEMHAEDSAGMKKSKKNFPVVSVTTHSQERPKECKTGTEWALHKADVDRFSTTLALQDKVNSLSKTVASSCDIKDNSAHMNPSPSCKNGRGPLTPNRTPLQRQEALFSKPWESSASRGKSQSHDSTDSGFSDSCEHHSSSSPGSSVRDPSIESLVGTTMELQELETSQAPSWMTPDDPKSKVSIQEKQKLEERISKLIYENSVLVEDKQLENVRPRKTVLSKQGSIDLPVPYTYKDSFHFEIKSSKHIANTQKQDRGGGAIYRSVPTQHSTSLEHAPLTRSSSFPFSVGSKQTDEVNNTNLSRRCSAGHVYPFRSTDQQAPSHRSLVRQAAVDCLPSSDGSTVDRGSITSLGSDGDSTDIGTESTINRNYKKKTRKFDYTKWHTYKGGTFTKLYSTDRDGPLNTKKTVSGIEHTESLQIQINQPRDNASVSPSFTYCSIVCLSQTGDMSLAQQTNQATSSYILLKSPPLETTVEESKILRLQSDPKHTSVENSYVKSADVEMEQFVIQSTDCHVPSERKKQRIANNGNVLGVSCPMIRHVNANQCGIIGQPPLPSCGMHSSMKVNVPNLHLQSSFLQMNHQFLNPGQLLYKTPNPAYCLINMSGKSCTPTISTSIPALPETKTSFPPKYQLKIPSSTDGALASCCASSSAPNTSQTLPALSQCHSENSLPSSKLGQGALKVAVCEKTLKPLLSFSGQTQTHSESSANTVLTVSCSGSANTTVQIHSSPTTSPMLQSHPASPVFSFESPPKLTEDTQCTVFENTLNSTVSKMATGDSQGSKSEEKVILLSGSAQSPAQNTFYVRTADLQIVMQLISDEQLALIQPHIEIPEFKPAESSADYFAGNPVTTSQVSLSQDGYSDDGTDMCVPQVNNGEMGQTSDKIISNSFGSANFESKARNADSLNLQNVENTASVNCSHPCVSYWSHSQTNVHTSDNRKNPTEQFYNPPMIPKNFQDRKCIGFNVTTESHQKQVADDRLSDGDLVDKSYSMRHYDKDCSSVCGLETVNPPDPRVSFSQDQTFTDTKQEHNNETSVSNKKFCLMESNYSQALKNTDSVEPSKTRHLIPVTVLRNGEGQQTMKTTQFQSCLADKIIPITTPSESQQMQKALTSAIQPCQSKLCWAACSALTSATSELKEYGTGSGEEGALKGLWFQRDPGTARQESVPKQPEGAGTDEEKLDTNMADMNTCQSCENNNKQDKRKEESSEEHQTAVQTHLHLSQEVINSSLNVSNSTHHDKFSIPKNPAPSVCNILSQTCQHQGQEGCNDFTIRDSEDGVFRKDLSQETSQRDAASPGLDLVSASPGLSVAGFANQASRHLLVHPLKKETCTKNFMHDWTSLEGTESQVTSPQNICSTQVLQNHCSALTTEEANTITISSSCAGLMRSNASYSQIIPINQICHPATVSTSQTDSKLFYSASNSYLQHEDSNSSSDDEQKLVIELE